MNECPECGREPVDVTEWRGDEALDDAEQWRSIQHSESLCYADSCLQTRTVEGDR